jgi:hypothetical protein
VGKIIGSWLLKVHQHEIDKAVDTPTDGSLSEPVEDDGMPPTIDELKLGITDGLQKELGGIWTVSLAEKTDNNQ